jgi:hypothetical protein
MKKLTRRNFLKRTSKGLASIAAASCAGSTSFCLVACTQKVNKEKSKGSGITCEFGVEGGFPGPETEELMPYLKGVHELGAEFIVVQFRPDSVNPTRRGWKGRDQDFKALAIACREFNLTYFVNQECTNYSTPGTFLDEEGNDLVANPDQTYRWDLTGEVLESAIKYPEFRGVMYDEAAHAQMRREKNTNGGSDSVSSGEVHPYWAVTDGMTLVEAYESVYKSVRTVALNYREKGVTPMTEHVFPAMLFTFARAGFDTATKFLKEGMDPVYGAIALGAARQYGRELCITPDLWGITGFPGHPPEEMRASFLYAYWLGATRIFVENIRGLLEKKVENDTITYDATEYGKVYRWLVKEYFPAHQRPYTFRDIRPEVAIIRFDDSCWGQKGSWLPDALYGAENLKTTPATAAWFQIWKLLTHGRTLEEGINYHNKAYNYGKPFDFKNFEYEGMSHDFFYPLKGVVVYDHLAGPKEIEGLKLIFLTGVLISEDTIKAVKKFVKKGGLCISLTSLAPAEFEERKGIVKDGSGHWLFTDDFLSDEVQEAVAPHLGKPDEINYDVGDKKLTIKRGEDNNTIKIYLQNKEVTGDDADLPESARVY